MILLYYVKWKAVDAGGNVLRLGERTGVLDLESPSDWEEGIQEIRDELAAMVRHDLGGNSGLVTLDSIGRSLGMVPPVQIQVQFDNLVVQKWE